MPEPMKKAGRTLKRWLAHYLYGLFARSWNSSITSVDAFIGLAVGAAVTAQVQAIDWKGTLAVFATSWARSALMYFKDHPLPEQLPETVAPFSHNRPAP